VNSQGKFVDACEFSQEGLGVQLPGVGKLIGAEMGWLHVLRVGIAWGSHEFIKSIKERYLIL
jgi:hypothetical protein